MLTSLVHLFHAPRSRVTGTSRGDRLKRTAARHRHPSLDFQPLEPRLALALTVSQTTLTTGTIAYDIVIDDTVNVSNGSNNGRPDGNTTGNGLNAYLQAATDGGSFFLLADNPSFNNALVLPWGFTNGVGTQITCSTVYVSSANSAAKPLSFTAFASSIIPNQRLLVQLDPAGSQISIGTPWQASLGTITGANDGVDRDPEPYRGFGFVNTATGKLAVRDTPAAGQIVLNADNVRVSSPITTSSRFNSMAPNLSNLSIDATVAAQNVGVALKGSATTAGQMRVGTAGSITASGPMLVDAQYSNMYFEGRVSSPTQTYLLRAPDSDSQYEFTTRSPSTGIATGLISGNTVAMTLGQPAGGTIDLKTNVSNLRFDAGVNASAVPYRYSVAIDEQNALSVDAVAASSGPIMIKAAGDMSVLGSAIRTSGDISLASSGTLSIAGDIATANGNVNLDAPTLTLSSGVSAGGGRNVTLVSRTGDTTANALTQAGGNVKQTVRVASVRSVALAGTSIIDGVTLANNDRVLLKKQTDPAENGLYVFSSAGGGVLSRSKDADTAAELAPGLLVFVSAGSQTGGWTLLNPSTPVLGQTGLQFAPASASNVYDDVKAATTANISLSGLQTIDAVALADGDRVLVKNQTNAAQNGLYVVAAGEWKRASDANTVGELTAGSFVFVQTGGTSNGGKGFALANDAVQVGTTPLTFADFFATASGSTSWAPARALADATVATTVNINLASIGLGTIDGVKLMGGERVLVKNQINSTENGVYVAAAGAWSRAGDADATGELPRGTAIYVTDGTLGRNTSWQFNDSIQHLVTTVANNATVTNLVSTAGLAVGMLVTGAGIPGGTTIASLGANGTSLRLSQNATVSGSMAALSFVKTSAVTVGADPVVFVPVGGRVTVTAAASIGGSSLLQGATALLAAGTANAAASSISAQTNFGRISASAPGQIVVTNATSVELQNVRTTKAGGISVTANGTATALSVVATGTAGSPGDVEVVSAFGDVVAESITANIGNIALTAINGGIAVTKARLNNANISAAAGSITATADAAGAVVTIDGRLGAGGTGGAGDVALLSNAGQLVFTNAANVVAADQLLISTPNSVPQIAGGTQIAAARLDLTSQFGKGVATPPAGLGTYQVVAINRTDAGDISFTSASDLTIESASTSDGSISFTAPNLKITGDILPQGPGSDADVMLTATSGNLFVDTAVTSQRDIVLSAVSGEVRGSGGGATALITAPRDVTVNASTVAKVVVKAAGFNATMSTVGATLNVVDTDGLDIKSVSLADGAATFTVGSVASGGDATVGLIGAGTKGSIELAAYGNITQNTVDAAADIVAGTLTLTSTSGRIDVDTDTGVLSASVQQKNQSVTIDDVGADGLEIRSISANNNANVSLTAIGPLLATSVITTGTIQLATLGPNTDIVVNQVSSKENAVTLSAAGSIKESTPTDATADIVGSAVSLTAKAGSIAAHVAASTVTATATAAGSTISLTSDIDLVIGGIDGKNVSLTVGGALAQSGAILADSLSVKSTGGKNITLNTVAGNKIGTFTADTTGNVLLKNAAAGLVVPGLSGNAVTLEATSGGITQTGAIKVGSLVVTAAGGAITLNTQANQVDTFTATNPGGTVLFNDTAGGLVLNGVTGSTVTIDAAGPVTQTAAVTANALTVNAAGNAITLTSPTNAVASIASSNGSGAVSFRDGSGDLSVAGITGGSVTLAAAGSITQSAAIKAASLAVTANGPSLKLDTVSNTVGALGATTNPGGGVTFVNAIGFAVSGAMTAGTGAAGDGSILLKATTGSIAVNANLTATKDTVTIEARQGSFSLGNGLKIDANKLSYYVATAPTVGTNTTLPATVDPHVAPPVPPTPPTPPGGTVSTASQLQQVVAVINALPIQPGTTYEIIVNANMTLTQTLVINRPVVLRGTSPSITISGSTAVVNGVILNADASGSQISSLAFRGFSGTGVQLTNARNIAISGIAVSNSGTGLSVNGAASGTTVQRCTFTNNPFGIKLVGASGATIGSMTVAQRNTISAAARAGVFASGACQGTQIIKTVFSQTRTQYSVANARFLRIIR